MFGVSHTLRSGVVGGYMYICIYICVIYTYIYNVMYWCSPHGFANSETQVMEEWYWTRITFLSPMVVAVKRSTSAVHLHVHICVLRLCFSIENKFKYKEECGYFFCRRTRALPQLYICMCAFVYSAYVSQSTISSNTRRNARMISFFCFAGVRALCLSCASACEHLCTLPVFLNRA